jgi:uncharacterized membrane protein YoaK (UPF0700 family)
MNSLDRNERIDAILLSFVASYVDTAVFVGLFGLFTSHVTGNFVLIGATLVHQTDGVETKLLALPVFVVAVAVTVVSVRALERRGRGSLPLLLIAEALLLAMSACTSTLMRVGVHPQSPLAMITGMLAVGAMGLQNAYMRIKLATLPPTTVMTGSVTQATIDVVAIMLPTAGAPDYDATVRRFARMWPGIVAFTIGAALGAFGFLAAGLLCLLAPAALCLVLAARLGRFDAAGRVARPQA